MVCGDPASHEKSNMFLTFRLTESNTLKVPSSILGSIIFVLFLLVKSRFNGVTFWSRVHVVAGVGEFLYYVGIVLCAVLHTAPRNNFILLSV